MSSFFRRRRLQIDCAALVAEIASRGPYPPKRRFRIRQDGWVRHDGGDCPLPDKVRVLIWHRGVDVPLPEQSDRVPEQWWRQEAGKYDVLWFRVMEDWRETPPPVTGSMRVVA